uniref:Uncharacterized protein n=1 Tax=Glossina austeni TaxID=7395 RepID=A0A1A9USG6_GLOAU
MTIYGRKVKRCEQSCENTERSTNWEWQKELACCANSSERFEYSDLLNVNLGLRQEFPFVVTIASIGADALQLRTTNIYPLGPLRDISAATAARTFLTYCIRRLECP